MDQRQAKIFMKYLVNAASKVETRNKTRRNRHKLLHEPLRLPDIEEDRQKELDKKVDRYFVKLKYDPYKNKIKDLREEIKNMKGDVDGRKLRGLRIRLKKCNKLLNDIIRKDVERQVALDVSRH